MLDGLQGIDPDSYPNSHRALKATVLEEVESIIDLLGRSPNPAFTLEVASVLGGFAFSAATMARRHVRDIDGSDPEWHTVESYSDPDEPFTLSNEATFISVIYNPVPSESPDNEPNRYRHFIRIPKDYGVVTLYASDYDPRLGLMSLSASIPCIEPHTDLNRALIQYTMDGKIRAASTDEPELPQIDLPIPTSWTQLDQNPNSDELAEHNRYRDKLIVLTKKVVLYTFEFLDEKYFVLDA